MATSEHGTDPAAAATCSRCGSTSPPGARTCHTCTASLRLPDPPDNPDEPVPDRSAAPNGEEPSEPFHPTDPPDAINPTASTPPVADLVVASVTPAPTPVDRSPTGYDPRRSAALVPLPHAQIDLSRPANAATAQRTVAGSRSARRVRLILASTVTVALLLTGVAALQLERLVYPPQTLAQQLITAIRDRDDTWIDQHANCPTAQLCTTGALRTGYQPPSQLHITAVHLAGGWFRPDRADITIRYTIGDTTTDEHIQMQRLSRGLLRRWAITKPPGNYLIPVSPHLTSVRIANAPIPTAPTNPSTARARSGDHIPNAVWALPGTYTITADTTHPLYQPTPNAITVTAAPEPQTHPVPTAIRDTATQQVTTQIRDHITTCAAQTDLRPIVRYETQTHFNRCPLRYTPTSYQPFQRNIQWKIEQYPTVELRPSETPGQAAVRTTQPGRATVTYEWTQYAFDPRTWTPAEETTQFTLDGTATTDPQAGTVTWTW